MSKQVMCFARNITFYLLLLGLALTLYQGYSHWYWSDVAGCPCADCIEVVKNK